MDAWIGEERHRGGAGVNGVRREVRSVRFASALHYPRAARAGASWDVEMHQVRTRGRDVFETG